jgi:hypothetical protein
MTHDPKNYRDPKVTTGTRDSGSAMRWVWIVVAIIVIVLLLSWVFGGFGADTVTTVPAGDTAPATTGTTEGTGTTGGTTGNATTGDTTTTLPAGDTTAPATDAPAEGGTTATPPAD